LQVAFSVCCLWQLSDFSASASLAIWIRWLYHRTDAEVTTSVPEWHVNGMWEGVGRAGGGFWLVRPFPPPLLELHSEVLSCLLWSYRELKKRTNKEFSIQASVGEHVILKGIVSRKFFTFFWYSSNTFYTFIILSVFSKYYRFHIVFSNIRCSAVRFYWVTTLLTNCAK
jgi:hypothetical protein